MDRPEFEVFYQEILLSLELGSVSADDVDATFKLLDTEKTGEISQKTFTNWWLTSYGDAKLKPKGRAALAGSRGR